MIPIKYLDPSVFLWLLGYRMAWQGIGMVWSGGSWHTGHSESHALKPTNRQPLRFTTAFYWWIVPFSHFLILFHLHFQCPLVPLASFRSCFATCDLPLQPEDHGNGSYSGWCTSLHWRVSTKTWSYLNLQVFVLCAWKFTLTLPCHALRLPCSALTCLTRAPVMPCPNAEP